MRFVESRSGLGFPPHNPATAGVQCRDSARKRVRAALVALLTALLPEQASAEGARVGAAIEAAAHGDSGPRRVLN